RPSDTIFVGNLPFSSTVEDVKTLFEVFGPIEIIRPSTAPSSLHQGYMHVQYKSIDGARAAIAADTQEPLWLLDRRLRVDYAASRDNAIPPSHRLYFYDFGGPESEVRATIHEYDREVVSVYFIRDKVTGEFRGSGIIQFVNMQVAANALQSLNGAVSPEGHTLHLKYS
ncbi:hypothetical protein FISHEDRAFT_25274, partial [Fistulina hepatica ATCC 64428]